MGEPSSPDCVFDFPMDEPEPHPAYDIFAPRPLPGYACDPNNMNGWIEADVPLLGELGEMGEPLEAEVDEPMVDPVIKKIVEPVVEVEEQVVALVMGMEGDLAMLFGDDDSNDDSLDDDEDDEEVWEVNEEWLMAPFTPPPMPVMPSPSTYELVKKVIKVSDAEVVDGIAIGEIGPRVSAVKGQDQQDTTQRDEMIFGLSQQDSVCVGCLLLHGLAMNHGLLDLGGRNNNHRKRINTDTCTSLVSYLDRILNDGTPRVDIAKKVVSPSVVEETVVKEKLSHVENTIVLGSKQQLPMRDSTSASNAFGNSLYANVTGKPSGTKLNFRTLFTPGEECPKNIGTGEMKNLKKTSQTPNGFPVDQKMEFKSTKQVYQPVSKKPTTNTSVNKKKKVDSAKEVSIQATNSSGSSFWNVDASSPSTTLVIEKIDKIEKLIIEGEVTVNHLKMLLLRVIMIARMRLHPLIMT
nr:hypothetical protein [Tanacetum cinerariifolium]